MAEVEKWQRHTGNTLVSAFAAWRYWSKLWFELDTWALIALGPGSGTVQDEEQWLTQPSQTRSVKQVGKACRKTIWLYSSVGREEVESL